MARIALTIALAALLSCALAAPAARAEPAAREAWEGTVLARSLNVRAGPGEGYRVVAKLKRGDRITAVDEQGRWVRLVGLPVEGAEPRAEPAGEGWAHRSFLRLPGDFMAPAFGAAGNAFLDWAAGRGDLRQVAIDADDRLSIVLAPEVAEEAAASLAREIGCAYRERLAVAAPVTVTVWPEEGPLAGWIAQAVCP